jgi:hypothetical protein
MTPPGSRNGSSRTRTEFRARLRGRGGARTGRRIRPRTRGALLVLASVLVAVCGLVGAAREDTDAGGSAVNLLLPIAVLLAVSAAVTYSYRKRKRRAAKRTTPHGGKR